jgi:hypothetical protein
LKTTNPYPNNPPITAPGIPKPFILIIETQNCKTEYENQITTSTETTTTKAKSGYQPPPPPQITDKTCDPLTTSQIPNRKLHHPPTRRPTETKIQ